MGDCSQPALAATTRDAILVVEGNKKAKRKVPLLQYLRQQHPWQAKPHHKIFLDLRKNTLLMQQLDVETRKKPWPS